MLAYVEVKIFEFAGPNRDLVQFATGYSTVPVGVVLKVANLGTFLLLLWAPVEI